MKSLTVIFGLLLAVSASADTIRITGKADAGMRITAELEYRSVTSTDPTPLTIHAPVRYDGTYELLLDTVFASGRESLNLYNITLEITADHYEPGVIYMHRSAVPVNCPSATAIRRIDVKPNQADPHFPYMTAFAIDEDGQRMKGCNYPLPVGADLELPIDLRWKF